MTNHKTNNFHYNLLFFIRIQDHFELRGLRTMIESGRIKDSILISTFTNACRNNDLRHAKLLADCKPEMFWYNTGPVGNINRYTVFKTNKRKYDNDDNDNDDNELTQQCKRLCY